MNISISGYGKYENENYGVNCLRVDIGMLSIFFSYDTVVAYHDIGHGLKVSENIWSTTTGKHLNWIDDGDKKSRLPREQFEEELQATLRNYGLTF